MAEHEPGPQGGPPSPGETAPRVGRYYLLEPVGQSGERVVYVGYDPTLERRVAIELLDASERGAERLLEEGRALANLAHPNVVDVLEVAEDDRGGVHFVTAPVEGQTLGAWLQAAPRTWREILRVLVDAGRGLAAIHAAGLAHGDVNPSVLRIDARDQVRVAGVRPEDDTVPEQAERMSADQRALCLCLLEALVERHEAVDPAQWRRSAAARDPEGEAPPPSVFEAIARGLADDPEGRHPSMQALLEALDPHEARPRHPATWIAGGLTLGMIGLVVGLVVAPEPAEPPEPPPPCAGLENTFRRAHWTQARREGIVTVERARDPMWSLTLGGLDDYAQRWDRALVEGCLAHADGSLTPVGLDERHRCLERLGRDFEVFVGLLHDEPSIAGRDAEQAVSSLQDPASCALPPSVLELTVAGYEASPSDAARALERDVAGQWARHRLGLEADAVARSFETRAATVEDRTLRADTYRYLAETAGDFAEKSRLVDLAVRSALEGRAYVMLAAGFIEQGRMREATGRLDQADERFELAEGTTVAIETLAADFPALEPKALALRGELSLARGNLARRQGDFVVHLEHQQAALEYFGQVEQNGPLSRAAAWTNVGEAHRLLGQSAEAEKAYTEAITLARPLLGKDSLELQAMYDGRGSARQDGGDWKGAQADYARILPREGPLQTSAQAMAAFNVSRMEAQRGELAAAAARCRDALAVIELGGPAPFLGAASLFELSCMSFETLAGGTLDADAMDRAYAELDRAAGGDVRLMVLAQMQMARTMLHVGRLDEASRWIERARASCADLKTPDGGSVEILAGALAAARGNTADARAAYQRSIEGFEARGLAEHPSLVEPLLGLAALSDGTQASALRARAQAIAARYDIRAVEQ